MLMAENARAQDDGASAAHEEGQRTVPYRGGFVRLTDAHLCLYEKGGLERADVALPLHQVQSTRLEIHPPAGRRATAVLAFGLTLLFGWASLYVSGPPIWFFPGLAGTALSVAMMSTYVYVSRSEAKLVIRSLADAIELEERDWPDASLVAFADEVRRAQARVLQSLAHGERVARVRERQAPGVRARVPIARATFERVDVAQTVRR